MSIAIEDTKAGADADLAVLTEAISRARANAKVGDWAHSSLYPAAYEARADALQRVYDRLQAAEAELASIKAGPIVYGRVPPLHERIVPAQGDERAEADVAILSALLGKDALLPGQRKALQRIHDRLPEIAQLRAKLNDTEKLLAKAIRTGGDRLYMMQAYRQMLGPKGLEVAQMWEKAGVLRQHTSWGPAAADMTGEERAQCHLDVEAAPKRRMLPGEIDGDTPEEVKARRAALAGERT